MALVTGWGVNVALIWERSGPVSRLGLAQDRIVTSRTWFCRPLHFSNSVRWQPSFTHSKQIRDKLVRPYVAMGFTRARRLSEVGLGIEVNASFDSQ